MTPGQPAAGGQGGQAAAALAGALDAIKAKGNVFAQVLDGTARAKEQADALAGAYEKLRARQKETADQLAEMAAAAEHARGPFLGLRNALAAVVESATASAASVRAALFPAAETLAKLTAAADALTAPFRELSRAWGDFRQSVATLLAPLRAVKDLVGGAAGALLALPGRLLGATADAARAGADRLRQPFQAIDTAVSAVQANVARFVAMASPGEAQRFQLAVDDLYASIGRALVPVLQLATTVFRSVGSTILGLNDHGQKLIGALAAGTVGLIAFAGAVLLVQTVASGGIAPLLMAVAGALGGFFAVFQSGPIKGVIDSVATAIGGVAEQFGAALERLAPAMGPVFAVLGQLGEMAAAVASFWAGVAADVAPALAAVTGGFRVVFEALRPAMEALVGANIGLLAEGIKAVASVAVAAVPYVTALAGAIADVISTVVRGIASLLSLIGISLPALDAAPRSRQRDNTGAAARSVSTGSVEDALRRARESAFGMGAGAAARPEVETANAAKEMAAKTKEIRDYFLNGGLKADIVNGIRELKDRAAGGAVDAVTPRPGQPHAPNPGNLLTPGGMAVEAYKGLRRLFG